MLKDSSLYVTSALISSAVNFLTLPLFTRYLTIEDYGLVALFILFGNVCSSIFSFGLQSAAYRFYFKFPIEIFRVINTTIILFVLGVFFLVGMFILHPNSERISLYIFDNAISAKMVMWAFLNGCFNYLFIYFSHMLAAQKRAATATYNAIAHVLLNVILTTYFLLVHSYTYLAPIYAISITNFIIVISTVFTNRNLFTWHFSVGRLKSAIFFSYPEVPNILIGLIYAAFDKGMLNKHTGLGSVGHYEFGTKFANFLKVFMDAINKSWAPFFMENAERREDDSKSIIVNRFYDLTFLFMFFGLGVAYFTEEALWILTTEDYHQAKYVTPLIIMYYLVGILGFLSVQQLMYAEKLIYMLPVTIVGVFSNVSLNIILIPIYGAIGAAIATASSSLVSSILLLWLANKVYPLPFSAWKLLGIYGLTIFFLIGVYPMLMVDGYGELKFLFKCFLLIIFFTAGAYLKYFKLSDVIVLIKIFKKKLWLISIGGK